MRVFFLTIFLLSCGKPHNKAVATVSSLEDVLKKRDFYIEQATKLTDEYGWLDFGCDGLLHNSIAAFSGFPVSPTLAKDAEGKWYRTPGKDCYRPDVENSTSISKDMFNGLMLWAYASKDLQTLKDLYQYGDDHNWIMGDANTALETIARVTFSPEMVLRLKKMIESLQPNLTGVIFEESDEGLIILRETFEAHLHVISILQKSMINGGITDNELAVLEAYTKRQPYNAFFQAMFHKFNPNDGNQERAINILMDASLFPNDRLPESKDRCSEYIWSHDEQQRIGQSEKFFWKPCPDESKVHPGTDLMFVAKLLEETP